MDKHAHWKDYLHLVELAQNNGYHSSIGMSHFQALQGHSCRTPLIWDHLEDRVLLVPKMLQNMEQQVQRIRKHLVIAWDRHKKYANSHKIYRQFYVRDKVFLRVFPHKCPIHYEKGYKLAPRFIGPFEILESIGLIAYRLTLPPNIVCVHDVFHISIHREYIPNLTHILDCNTLQVEDGKLALEPTCILQWQTLTLGAHSIETIRVLWDPSDQTFTIWEDASTLRVPYPYLFVGFQE